MSHTVKQKSACTDIVVLALACKRLGAELLGKGRHQLFDGASNGIGIKLPNWSYPLVIQENGEIAYDDYNGRWGNTEDLNKLKQAYAVSAAYVAYDGKGTVVETPLDNGEIRVEINLGGGTTSIGGGQVTGPGGISLG